MYVLTLTLKQSMGVPANTFLKKKRVAVVIIFYSCNGLSGATTCHWSTFGEM
jgi:hypothetical protein